MEKRSTGDAVPCALFVHGISGSATGHSLDESATIADLDCYDGPVYVPLPVEGPPFQVVRVGSR